MSEFFGISPEAVLAAHILGETLIKSPFFVVSKNEKWTHEAESKFLSTLPFYGVFSTDLDLIKHLLQPGKYDIADITGNSGYKTYGLSVDNKLQFVIKTADGSGIELARDVSSRALLKNLDLKESRLAELLLAGTYQRGNGPFSTISIQKAALGKSLTDWIGCENIEDAVKSGAKAVAELHLKNHKLATPLKQPIMDLHLELFQKIIRRLHEDLKMGLKVGLNGSDLDHILKKTVEAVQGNWGLSGYSHGDCSVDHLFFDQKSNTSTFIDTASFIASIDSGRRPIGFPPFDFSWVWASLAESGFRANLTQERVHLLQDTFKNEYEQQMGQKLAPLPARAIANLTKELYFLRLAAGQQNEKWKDYLLKDILGDK